MRNKMSVEAQNMAKARKFISTHLKECCQELLEWDKTSLLRDGKVRECADIYMNVATSMSTALNMVRSEVSRQAMTYITQTGG